MNIKKFEKFIKTGKLNGCKFSSIEFIKTYRTFLSQNLESVKILDTIDCGIEPPFLGLQKILKSMKSQNQIKMNGLVEVQIIRNFVVDSKSFHLECDAYCYAKANVGNNYYAKIIDYRFSKPIIKVIK